MCQEYKIGNSIFLDARFELDNVDTDPTSVEFKIKQPNGNYLTYLYGTDGNVSKLATGRYRCQFLPTQMGIHTWRAKGTGDVVAQDEMSFNVIGMEVV